MEKTGAQELFDMGMVYIGAQELSVGATGTMAVLILLTQLLYRDVVVLVEVGQPKFHTVSMLQDMQA